MTTWCGCGGRFVRTDVHLDISATLKHNRPMYTQRSTAVATWKCNRCGEERKQRLRQPRRGTLPGEQEFDGSGIS